MTQEDYFIVMGKQVLRIYELENENARLHKLVHEAATQVTELSKEIAELKRGRLESPDTH